MLLDRPTICCNDVTLKKLHPHPRRQEPTAQQQMLLLLLQEVLLYILATICMMLLCVTVHMCPKRTYNLRICVCVYDVSFFFLFFMSFFFSGSPNPTRLSLLFCTAQPRTFHLSHRFSIYVYFSVYLLRVYTHISHGQAHMYLHVRAYIYVAS